MGLELYGRIEPFLGFEDQVRELYGIYLDRLAAEGVKSLLDVGCGGGAFLLEATERLGLLRHLGVDLSRQMVARARKRGVRAEAVDVCRLQEGDFEAATAVFDVLNYLPPDALDSFLACVAERLVRGGIFLADVNTAVGFEEVAPGALVRRPSNGRLIVVEADYAQGRLVTKIDDFCLEEDGRYRRESDEIVQYYHPPELFEEKGGVLQLQARIPICMYADEPDKELLLFRRL